MADTTSSVADEPVVSFIKKKGKGRPNALRKRPLDDDDDAASPSTSASTSEPSTSEVVIASKKAVANHLVQGTAFAKRRKAEEALLLAESDEEDEGVKEKESYAVRHSAATKRERRRSSSPPAEMSAESIKAAAAMKLGPGQEEEAKKDGLYHGKQGQAHKLPKAFGPVKGGPGNVRTITMVDYQPDVCKDYKETGFCGFGDTCKFLHDRGDYLHGWQLDNSFLSSSAAAGSFMAKQAARDGGQQTADDSDSDNADLPFACLICRNPFGKDPVVTLCGHYFDSACAIKRFAKTGKCFACGKGTNGVFNKATKLIAKQKEREALNAAATAEEREFEEDDDGLEIEGLATEEAPPMEAGIGTEEAGGSEEEEEEEEDRPKPPPKRRPIIEIEDGSKRRNDYY